MIRNEGALLIHHNLQTQLDVGDPEKIMLMSRDSQTMIIVSYVLDCHFFCFSTFHWA